MKKLISIILAAAVVFSFAATAFAAPSNLITKEEAKAIALEHAGVAKEDVRFLKSKLEFDDGIYEYEIEFDVGFEKEYEYTVNAENGNIIDYDMDIDRADHVKFSAFLNWFRNLFAVLFGKA